MSSILSDFDTIFEEGNLDIAVVTGNENNSELKNALHLNYIDEPFSITEIDEEKAFTITGKSYTQYISINNVNITNIVGFTLDNLKISDNIKLKLCANELDGNNLAKNIYCTNTEITANLIKDLSINYKDTNYSLAYIIITTKHKDAHTTLSNVNINLNNSIVKGINVPLIINTSCMIPTFNNVKSTGIKSINLSFRTNELFTLHNSEIWNKLFKFNYSFNTSNKEIKISSMNDIYKKCVSNATRKNIITDIPYGINENVKLTDIIDVSGFESYKNDTLFINMFDKKFGILICKDLISVQAYIPDMFIGKNINASDLLNHKIELPKTSDGYYIIPYKL